MKETKQSGKSISKNTSQHTVEENYTVYLHIFPNKKVYVGITNQTPERRWRKGKGYRHHQQLVYRAFQKYEWDDIQHLILEEGLSKDEAERKEVEYICKYNSSNAEYGYNSESGGSVHKHVSEETKEKLRQINLGKKHTEEEKRKMSVGMKKAYAEGRKSLSEEHWLKMYEARKDLPAWNKGKIIPSKKYRIQQITKDGELVMEYVNLRAAMKAVGSEHVRDVLAGRRKSAAGFLWKRRMISGME